MRSALVSAVRRSLPLLPLAAFVATAAVFGCSAHDGSVAEPLAEPTSAQTTSPLEAAHAGSPASTLLAGGTFWFVFDESKTVLERMTARCQQDEPTNVAGCVDAVRKQGDREGFRFHGDDPSSFTWTSFGEEDGKEVVYLEVPLAITDVAGGIVHTRVNGPIKGLQAKDAAPYLAQQAPPFEIVDAKTIAMLDPNPKKGRLVFRTR